jgi:hypothetical protein
MPGKKEKGHMKTTLDLPADLVRAIALGALQEPHLRHVASARR